MSVARRSTTISHMLIARRPPEKKQKRTFDDLGHDAGSGANSRKHTERAKEYQQLAKRLGELDGSISAAEDHFRMVLALIISKRGMERGKKYAQDIVDLLPSEAEVPDLVKRADELLTAQSTQIAAAEEDERAMEPEEETDKVPEPVPSGETTVSTPNKPWNGLFGQKGGVPVAQEHGLGLGGFPILRALTTRGGPPTRDPATISCKYHVLYGNCNKQQSCRYTHHLLAPMLYSREFQNALHANNLPSHTMAEYPSVRNAEDARLGKKKMRRDNAALPQNSLVLKKKR